MKLIGADECPLTQPAEILSPHSVRPESLVMVDELNGRAEQKWERRLCNERSLTRSLVSFQANKGRAVYRWFKYKEAFSADLVEFLLNKYHGSSGRMLDPFAGSGTAMFAAAALGIEAVGIELLPIGQTIIRTKTIIDSELRPHHFNRLKIWRDDLLWRHSRSDRSLPELRITRGAYPEPTAGAISSFLASIDEEDAVTGTVLKFALLCILESISFTRKDGQYLRWDYRSGRRQGKKRFDKGQILSFDAAMVAKLDEIIRDIGDAGLPDSLFASKANGAEVHLHSGSSLELMPQFPTNSYDCIITSPPYCNRYDYTRTYALELALLGVDEAGLGNLRQQMLSCTVENRAKDLLALNANWRPAISAADDQTLLNAVLSHLESQKALDNLNNNGIPRMVRGYFYEMACIIAECARVLKPNAPMIMVNDNVRYAGAGISVDIILSEIAEKLGFRAESVLVLPSGKGNSSQQMGEHGRQALRKCVYHWRKI